MTYEQAVASLQASGPGSICEECGHFAMRHGTPAWEGDLACHFPRPVDNPCFCKGMLWHGHRIPMAGDAGPVTIGTTA
jgi:hypothetical protein